MFTFNGFLAKLKTKFSTNKTPTNNHRFPLVLSDGTPDGNATPADIMQLLGAKAAPDIPINTDLNTMMTQGKYRCVNGTLAASMGNCPISETGFMLIVLNVGTNTIQILMGIGGGPIYSRGTTGSSWTEKKWSLIQKTEVA